MTGASTMVQGLRIVPLLLPECPKRQLMGRWWAFVAKSTTVQSVKGGVLLESWVQFAAPTSLKKFVMCWPFSSVYDSAHLQKLDVSGWNAQIWQVPGETTQWILFSGLQLTSSGSLGRMRRKKSRTWYLNTLPSPLWLCCRTLLSPLQDQTPSGYSRLAQQLYVYIAHTDRFMLGPGHDSAQQSLLLVAVKAVLNSKHETILVETVTVASYFVKRCNINVASDLVKQRNVNVASYLAKQCNVTSQATWWNCSCKLCETV